MEQRQEVFLVTGGASGIGRATAMLFAQRGYRVVIADLADGDDVVSEIQALGGEALFVRTDVRDEAQVERMVARTVDRFGRLDFAYNNAGIGGGRGSIAGYALEEFERVMAVNLTGVFLCMKHQLRRMEAQTGGGRIVNASSIAGLTGFPTNPAYGAAKAAVVSLTRSAAAMAALKRKPIRVNCVCPGWIDTPLLTNLMSDPTRARSLLGSIPDARLGAPGEVAEVVLWLCTEAPAYLNGEAIRVDGGLLSASPTHTAILGQAAPIA